MLRVYVDGPLLGHQGGQTSSAQERGACTQRGWTACNLGFIDIHMGLTVMYNVHMGQCLTTRAVYRYISFNSGIIELEKLYGGISNNNNFEATIYDREIIQTALFLSSQDLSNDTKYTWV